MDTAVPLRYNIDNDDGLFRLFFARSRPRVAHNGVSSVLLYARISDFVTDAQHMLGQ